MSDFFHDEVIWVPGLRSTLHVASLNKGTHAYYPSLLSLRVRFLSIVASLGCRYQTEAPAAPMGIYRRRKVGQIWSTL